MKFSERPAKDWDGLTAIYSEDADEYFHDESQLYEFLDEYPEYTIEELKLVLCDGIHLREREPCEWFYEDTEFIEPDQLYFDKEVVEAVKALNEAIAKHPPIGWEPGRYAAKLPLQGLFANPTNSNTGEAMNEDLTFEKEIVWKVSDGRYRSTSWGHGELELFDSFDTIEGALGECTLVKLTRGEVLRDDNGQENWFIEEHERYILVCNPTDQEAIKTDGKIPLSPLQTKAEENSSASKDLTFEKKIVWLRPDGDYFSTKWADDYLNLDKICTTIEEALEHSTPTKMTRGEILYDKSNSANWFIEEHEDYILVCGQLHHRAEDGDGKIPLQLPTTKDDAISKPQTFEKKVVWKVPNSHYSSCKWSGDHLAADGVFESPEDALDGCVPVKLTRGKILCDRNGYKNWFIEEHEDYILMSMQSRQGSVETDGKVPLLCPSPQPNSPPEYISKIIGRRQR